MYSQLEEKKGENLFEMGDGVSTGSSTPGWLERTFLYTFGLSGLILLLHTGNIWMQVGLYFKQLDQ